MNITKALVDEHVLILKGLDFLRIARDHIEQNQLPSELFFEKAVSFFRNYADKYHHYKEEFLMFGFLARKKEGLMDLEIGSLRLQHETGRESLTKLEKSIQGYSMRNEIAITTLLGNMASFTSVLSRHIFMEDNFFFPMVEKELTSDEKEILFDQFRVEEKIFDEKKVLPNNLELLEEMKELITVEL